MTTEQRVAYWQRRARDAERVAEFHEKEMASCQRWGERAYVEMRYLYGRVEFLYAEAVKRGATREDLTQPETWPAP